MLFPVGRNDHHSSKLHLQFQDQIIVFMALAEGQSSVLTGPLEMHTRTAIHFAEIITGVKFEVEEITNEKHIIKCNGIGHKL